jgi:hypothetical protein
MATSAGGLVVGRSVVVVMVASYPFRFRPVFSRGNGPSAHEKTRLFPKKNRVNKIFYFPESATFFRSGNHAAADLMRAVPDFQVGSFSEIST